MKITEKGVLCKENEWIKKLLLTWTQPPLSSAPQFESGKQILEELISMETPVELETRRIPVTFNQEPTLLHVFLDLVNQPKGAGPSDIVDYYQSEGVIPTVAEMICSWITAPARCNSNTCIPRLYAVLSIPMTKLGIETCSLKLGPSFTNNAIVKTIGKNRRLHLWTSAIVPLGAVTHPHTDYSGCGQVMFHIEGEKLWLLWPPTKNNMRWYRNVRDRFSNSRNTTVEAIQNMEGLKVIFCKEKIAFPVDPYGFHAVLTFSTAAHTGSRVWSFDFFNESMAAISEEIKWSGQPANGIPINECIQRLREIKEDLTNWEELAVTKTNDNRSPYISKYIPELKQYIENLMKNLDVSGKSSNLQNFPIQ